MNEIEFEMYAVISMIIWNIIVKIQQKSNLHFSNKPFKRSLGIFQENQYKIHCVDNSFIKECIDNYKNPAVGLFKTKLRCILF